MGYTHYWEYEDLNVKIFKSVIKDMKTLIHKSKKLKIPLAGGNGSGNPIINDSGIIFNGKGEDSYETFSIKPNTPSLNFCKTGRKPYDIYVTSCLVILKYYYKDEITIHSDGELYEWEDSINLCEKILGYGSEIDFGDNDYE